MEMNLSREVNASLEVLGLAPGATAADVRSAFRRLARACHPDVAGRKGALRFQEISGAYALLKGLAPDELTRLAQSSPAAAPPRGKRSTLRSWYQRRRQRPSDRPAEPREAGRAQEEERQAQARSDRVDRVLDQYDRNLSRRLERIEKNTDQGLVNDILARLDSSVAAVRRLALGRIGSLANRDDILQALTSLLCRWDVDERTARLVAGLPLKPEALRRLAGSLSQRAAGLPNSLISCLLGLRSPDSRADPALMERYLMAAGAEGVALILRYWPPGIVPGDGTLRRLLDSEEEEVLSPVLSAMKQGFPEAAARFRGRLEALAHHPAAAVRVWSRALLSG